MLFFVRLILFTLLATLSSTAFSSDVRQVQSLLTELNYNPGAVDGIYGKNTERALKEFYERTQSAPYDGVISANEILDLYRALGRDPVGIIGEFSEVKRQIPDTRHQIHPDVEKIYRNYERIIHPKFDFPSLRLTTDDFQVSRFRGDSKTDKNGYYFLTMIQYGDFGDLDGDGDNDLVVGGWRAYSDNAPTRLHFVFFENGRPISTKYIGIEGTSAPWVRDFDNDGIAEVLAIGFLDAPVNPAPTYYVNVDQNKVEKIGPEIDSHESNVVDFDNDGDLDVIAITYAHKTPMISLYLNNGSTFEHKYLKLKGRFKGSSIEYADFNGDGVEEIIIGDSEYPNEDHGLWEIKLTPQKDPFQREVKSSRSVAPQYFLAPEYKGIKSLWDLRFPTAEKKFLDGYRSHDVLVEALDIDNDGDLDLINSTSTGGDKTPMGVLQILVNDGFGNFTDQTDTRLLNYQRISAHSVFAIDVNSDDYPDLITSDGELWTEEFYKAGLGYDLSKATSGNKLLINDGTGHFVEAHHSIFTDLSVRKDWANSWFPVINEDGTLTFTSLYRTQDGKYDLWQYAKLKRPLSTGPYFEDPAVYGVPGFNEFYVLRTNKSAREAVLSGKYESALAWYIATKPSIKINSRSAITCADNQCAGVTDAKLSKKRAVAKQAAAVKTNSPSKACLKDPQVCSVQQLCEVATSQGANDKLAWSYLEKDQKHVVYAKQRNVYCLDEGKLQIALKDEIASECRNNPQKCSVADICEGATYEDSAGLKNWRSSDLSSPIVRYAKQSGLDCGVK